MLKQTLVFAVVISISQAVIDCNGVEYSNGGQTIAFPIDVCHGQFINGAYTKNKYQCQNNKIYWNLYTTQDCDGDPSSSLLFSSLYPSAEYINEYCNLSIQCQYIKIKTYDKSFENEQECNSYNTTNTDHIDELYIDNYCYRLSSTQSFIFNCDNTLCTESVYSSSNCNQASFKKSITFSKITRDCKSNSNGYIATELSTRNTTANPIESGDTLPTSTSTTTTTEITTISPITTSDDLSCNAFEYTISGVR